MSDIKQTHSAKIETTSNENKYKDIEDAIQKAIESEKLKANNSESKPNKSASK